MGRRTGSADPGDQAINVNERMSGGFQPGFQPPASPNDRLKRARRYAIFPFVSAVVADIIAVVKDDTEVCI
jgi:hypothetical protein